MRIPLAKKTPASVSFSTANRSCRSVNPPVAPVVPKPIWPLPDPLPAAQERYLSLRVEQAQCRVHNRTLAAVLRVGKRLLRPQGKSGCR